MESAIGQDLASLRLSASKFFALLIWLHVPIVAGIALSNGMPAGRIALTMALAAIAATIAVRFNGGGIAARMVVAWALTMAPILMVYAGTGPWQVDWHMYFFVVFGMLVAYVDWRPVAVAATFTAAHHFILSLLFPSAVFPESDFARVLLHAVIVLLDSVVLFWLIRRMTLLFRHTALVQATLEERIVQRSAEAVDLNLRLAAKVKELEHALVALEHDAAERRETAVRLDHLAHHDTGTGLPNRMLLVDQLTGALEMATRLGGEIVVISIDLENFKNINDRTGRTAGDQALINVGSRLMHCIRSGDTVSRVGSDEFVVVCNAVDGAKEIPRIVERVIAAIAAPMDVGSIIINLAASVGVSLFPADGADPEELIKKAEAAMYRAKKSAGEPFHRYTPKIHEDMLAESQLLTDLERAIEDRQFVVHYQPVVSLTSRAIIGAEALVRWQHPTRGLLPPSEFITFAEENGLIRYIGTAVFDAACAQIEGFARITNAEFTMAVNVSAIQFRQCGFVESVIDILERHGVDSGRLEIEITESVIMDETELVIATLKRLESLGVKLSIDDFGTGYSSLSYVKNFPVQTLKIDRSFVRDIAGDSTDQAIAATIIALAHNLGMRVVAEGVETHEQLERLHLLGADDMQGYLIARPLSGPDFEQFAASYRALVPVA